MTQAEDNRRLSQLKIQLADKYDRLTRLAKGAAKRKALENHAARFRRQAADLTRR